MAYSLNQFIKKLTTLAAVHQQIHSFGLGDWWEIGSGKLLYYQGSNPNKPTYPLMWVVIEPSSIVKLETQLKFSLLFMDLVHKDERNENEVLSDMLLVAQDIKAQLQDPSIDEFTPDPNSSLESFTEKIDDEVSGWNLKMTIRIPYTGDRCAVPAS